jgi:preprotein translocase subunit SecE
VAKVTGKTRQNPIARIFDPITRYLRETRAELRKVSWPSRDEAWNLTLVVLGATLGMSIVLGLFDFLFSRVVQGIVTSNLIWIGAGVLVVVIGVASVYTIGRE